MKRIFIGHRGVGKTSLLERHKNYFPQVAHFDLDREIEVSLGVNISTYFLKEGEESFRKLEKEFFKSLIAKNENYVIAVGAGFDVESLPKESDTIFITRSSDKDGRIFLNRPRLQPDQAPLDEFYNIYQLRQNKFIGAANRIYFLPEGVDAENRIEKHYFQETSSVEDAYYALSMSDLKKFPQLKLLYKKIELRTDLISFDYIQQLIEKNSDIKWLVSIRDSQSIEKISLISSENVMIDVDLQYSSAHSNIISSHADNIEMAIQSFEERDFLNKHLKLCPLVQNWRELQMGFLWQQADPANRSFLPRSVRGEWLWYRQLCKYSQKINFVKSFTNNLDQPSFYEWLVLPELKPTSWAAVVGHPVTHSRSPVFHENFFQDRDSFFTKIDLSVNKNNIEELKGAIFFIIQMGLKYLAITSPFKEIAAEIFNSSDNLNFEKNPINTVFCETNKKFSLANTDLVGFSNLCQDIDKNEAVAVWGGGGTLNIIKKALPNAHFFSSRSGKRRNGEPALNEYKYIIWAASGSSQLVWPDKDIKFSHIIDLNYRENSLGLEFAQKNKISYTSGLEMFRTQALEQQKFWSNCERK